MTSQFKILCAEIKQIKEWKKKASSDLSQKDANIAKDGAEIKKLNKEL